MRLDEWGETLQRGVAFLYPLEWLRKRELKISWKPISEKQVVMKS